MPAPGQAAGFIALLWAFIGGRCLSVPCLKLNRRLRNRQSTKRNHYGIHSRHPRNRQETQRQRTRIPASRHRSVRIHRTGDSAAQEISGRQNPRAHRRAGTDDQFPRSLAGRQRPDPDQPRLPHPDEQRHRALQGRPALPSHRVRQHPEVPRLRAGLQELAHHPADGRRQGRLGLRSQGQERQRSHALLPVLHDRTVPPHRPGHRRAGGRHRRGRP